MASCINDQTLSQVPNSSLMASTCSMEPRILHSRSRKEKIHPRPSLLVLRWVVWNSKTSTRVLDSSTDAECCSLVAFGKENAWVRGILRELGIFKLNKPTLVLEDNTAAIALSGQGPTKRSRHYDISFFLFKEQVAMGEIKVEYC